jgi:acyl-CoA synthetase (AMP-forming)/AMP-acid ligase II
MIFESLYEDVDIPDIMTPLFVMQRAKEYGQRPALIDGPSGRTIAYEQLQQRARHAAKSLTLRGYRKGDIFAIYSPNTPEYAIAFHAIAMIGGVIASINPLRSLEETEQWLNRIRAKCILTTTHFMEKASRLKSRTSVAEIFTFDQTRDSSPFSELYESVMQPNEAPTNALINPRRDVLALSLTSGAVGAPRIVVQTHYGYVANLCQFEAVDPIGEGEVILGVAPMHHVYGRFMLLCHALRHGATVITLPRFELKTFLRAIETYRVTRAPVTPPIISLLADSPLLDEFDLRSLSHLYTTGSAQDPEIAARCAARLQCVVKQGYGLTEAGPALSVSADPDHYQTTGSILPNTQIRVVDALTGAELPVDEAGEIWVRGPQVMEGYLDNPEETAAVLDDDGWLKTGDLGAVDEFHRLKIIDRIEDLIRFDRILIAPSSVESILYTHPEVAEAAVIGVSNDQNGAALKAFVVPRGAVAQDELHAFLAERLDPQLTVQAVEFVDAIPKSQGGKVLRRVLRDREWAIAASVTY